MLNETPKKMDDAHMALFEAFVEQNEEVPAEVKMNILASTIAALCYKYKLDPNEFHKEVVSWYKEAAKAEANGVKFAWTERVRGH